jgi:hypothetical protein
MSDKHSSLFCRSISDKEERFTTLTAAEHGRPDRGLRRGPPLQERPQPQGLLLQALRVAQVQGRLLHLPPPSPSSQQRPDHAEIRQSVPPSPDHFQLLRRSVRRQDADRRYPVRHEDRVGAAVQKIWREVFLEAESGVLRHRPLLRRVLGVYHPSLQVRFKAGNPR